MMNAIKAGMDVISTHLSVLLLPLALDAVLWFGPRLSVKNLLTKYFDQLVAFNLKNNIPIDQLAQNRADFIENLSRYNLFSLLRTFPVGVTSLISGSLTIENPLGAQSVIEVASVFSLFGWLILLILSGWLAGGLYFTWVSRIIGTPGTGGSFARAVMQTFLFCFIFSAVTALIGLPTMLLLATLGLISQTVLQIALFILALASAWIIVPLYFSPLGIYVRGSNAFRSIFTSFRMARFTLPTSSMFVLAIFIISQGMNYLWAVPAENSWMRLVGIAGHAFITTALLAASFIYYRDLNDWLEIVFERMKTGTAAPQA